MFNVYGEKVEAQGPTYKGHKIKGNQIVVELGNAQGLKTTDGAKPTGFQVAGKDMNWVEATATINGASVEVSAEGVAEPAFVRYAYVPKPSVNLVNAANLPAYPFRTDDKK